MHSILIAAGSYLNSFFWTIWTYISPIFWSAVNEQVKKLQEQETTMIPSQPQKQLSSGNDESETIDKPTQNEKPHRDQPLPSPEKPLQDLSNSSSENAEKPHDEPSTISEKAEKPHLEQQPSYPEKLNQDQPTFFSEKTEKPHLEQPPLSPKNPPQNPEKCATVSSEVSNHGVLYGAMVSKGSVQVQVKQNAPVNVMSRNSSEKPHQEEAESAPEQPPNSEQPVNEGDTTVTSKITSHGVVYGAMVSDGSVQVKVEQNAPVNVMSRNSNVKPRQEQTESSPEKPHQEQPASAPEKPQNAEPVNVRNTRVSSQVTNHGVVYGAMVSDGLVQVKVKQHAPVNVMTSRPKSNEKPHREQPTTSPENSAKPHQEQGPPSPEKPHQEQPRSGARRTITNNGVVIGAMVNQGNVRVQVNQRAPVNVKST